MRTFVALAVLLFSGGALAQPTTAAPCPSGVMTGCSGELSDLANHDVAGTITAIDDCSFEVTGWEYDGTGPAVEWWMASATTDGTFDYPATSIKVSDDEVVAGTGQTITVTLGEDADGEPYLITPELNHVSVWCEEFKVDFGNAVLECEPDDEGEGAASTSDSSDDEATPSAPVPP